MPDIDPRPLEPPNVVGPEVVESDSEYCTVEYRIRLLKHNLVLALDPVVIRVGASIPSGLNIPYRINAANLRDECVGQLHIRFSMEQ